MTPGPAIVVLGARCQPLAMRLRAALPGSAVHAPDGIPGADARFVGAADHLRRLFAGNRPIIGVCASGILIRALAPLLCDKRAEPPVIAVAEDGSAVVPLLGGHRGGNALARRLGELLGVAAAVTTAGDRRLGVALDEPPPGWTLANPHDAKAVVARLLDGGAARLRDAEGEAPWLRASGIKLAEEGAVELLVTPFREVGGPGRLVYHPPRLAVGVGTERGAPPAALAALLEAVCDEAGLARESLAVVASIDLKSAEPAIHALGLPARFFPPSRLNAETERLTERSSLVFRATGCWGVAEAAALAAVGPGGRLVVTKRKGERVTLAVACAALDIDPGRVGRGRGRLTVVGLGPGGPDGRTAAAARHLEEAEELVGYGLYLDLVGAAGHGKPRHAFPLGAELDRCRFALQRAAEGRSVALVCSGDPGIYALATLVFELLERPEDPAWARVDIAVSPGVSALQAAAARAGAPLGHDFCAISLSDLLTSREVIEQRLRCAAAADLAIALYNPVSSRRQDLLPRAREILLEHRPRETPVVVARNLDRPGESVRLMALAELTTDMCDMLTIVLVGSNATRRVPRLHGRDWAFTPRGYAVP